MVGVDGSRGTHATVDLAAAEAVRLRTPLLILHAWPGRYLGAFRGHGGVPTPADGRHLLDLTAARARLAEPGLPVDTEMVTGGAAETLTRYSAGARLLVVGHADDPLQVTWWGATATYLAHHSRCPLMVGRGADPDGPVVVATSARSPATTLGYGFAEAARRKCVLVAVHMWNRPWAADGSLPVVAAGGFAHERRDAARRLARALDRWRPSFPEVPVEQLIVSDLDLACTVERASHRGRLVVAGMGGHGRFAELLYGSAARRSAQCPVVLVPEGWPVEENASAGPW